jgi:hypothetical protein
VKGASTPPTPAIAIPARGGALPAPWQPAWRPDELVTARYLPMGLVLELVTNSTLILEAAHGCFGGFGDVCGIGGDGGAGGDGAVPVERPPDLVLRLFAEGEEPAADEDQPLLRCSGPYLYQASGGGSVLVADRAAGMAFGHLAPSTVANVPLLRSRYLEAALGYLLECRGFVGLHGAAVARGGRGLLLRGRSGQGKTTLAYAAARRGMRAVAEDVVWVDTGGARWWGMPWRFHLLPDARRLFPELAGLPPVRQLNDEWKVEVDLEEMRRGSTAASAAPGPVVLLERRTGAASSLEAVAPDAARRAWLDGSAEREAEVPAYEAAMDALLRGGAWRLRLGDDLDAAVDLLGSLLP